MGSLKPNRNGCLIGQDIRGPTSICPQRQLFCVWRSFWCFPNDHFCLSAYTYSTTIYVLSLYGVLHVHVCLQISFSWGVWSQWIRSITHQYELILTNYTFNPPIFWSFTFQNTWRRISMQEFCRIQLDLQCQISSLNRSPFFRVWMVMAMAKVNYIRYGSINSTTKETLWW